ncbi:MAG: DUF2769 domain-containing protein [Planctomycetota bacterium]|jgi:hypothetical protein
MARVEDTPENFSICMDGNCFGCPSYPEEAGGEEGLYCARDRGSMEIEKNGCNCPECPVWQGNGLKGMYFCS